MTNILSIESFKFEIGGFGSTSFNFLLHENIISYYSYQYLYQEGDEHRKEISAEAMALFISRLNEINILGWKNKYDSFFVLDGVQWQIWIKYNSTKKKKIYGSNEYPGSYPHSCERTSQFDEFLEIIKHLIQDPSISI
jgi:hypothetical protein